MTLLSGFDPLHRALANPNYGRYTAGSSVSLIGTWMQRIAVGWLAWDLTGSGAWLGLLAFADLFPTVLIGPFAGALADRWDRLRVVRTSQALALGQCLALLGLVVTGLITPEWLLALTLFLGIVVAVNQPARLALIPHLVRPEDMPAAVAINSVIFNAARFIGPAVAGVLIATSGVAAALAANAATFVIFLVALSSLKLVGSDDPGKGPRRGGLLLDIGSGFRYAAGHPGIAPALALLAVVCLGIRPFVELLPGFAGRVFEAGAEGLAAMTAAIGLGAVLAGLWLARRGETRGLTGIVIGSSLMLALALQVFAATDSLWVALPLLSLIGAGMVANATGTQILLQLSVEPALRGRVMSLYGLIIRGGPALGALAMGAASELVGLGPPLAAGAFLALLLSLLVWLRRARIRAALEGAD